MKNILYSSLFLLAAAGGVAQAQTQAKVTSIPHNGADHGSRRVPVPYRGTQLDA